ncbi:mechanosensitive ion channel domain-containing protein [Rapidithrix thailandica]|uniref:Mechanosensitive ion channel domain-containing protein n=1 Tax=Rapidithrix thailandica TaxID=413964 RepID=A0AAW9RNU4_9BACT
MNVLHWQIESSLLIHSLLISTGLFSGLVLRFMVIKTLEFYQKQQNHSFLNKVLKHLHGTLYSLLPFFITLFLLTQQKELVNPYWIKIFQVAFIISLSWIGIRLLYLFEDLLLEKYDISVEDNFKARKMQTQLKFLKSIGVIAIVIISIAAISMNINALQNFGKGLLASAGVAGIIVGFAAQRSIANLLAGIQIAFTQPIKLDDAVLVEGEWGKIEEINLTYVVVKIWDLRRLILPITYFIEKPFQNWTKTTADLIGNVILYTDYRMPVDKIRQKLKEILEEEPHWDRNTCVLQVVDNTERTLQLRALMSARNSGLTWDLRCSVREKLIHYIQHHYPEYLPKSRVYLESPSDNGFAKAPKEQQQEVNR